MWQGSPAGACSSLSTTRSTCEAAMRTRLFPVRMEAAVERERTRDVLSNRERKISYFVRGSSPFVGIVVLLLVA